MTENVNAAQIAALTGAGLQAPPNVDADNVNAINYLLSKCSITDRGRAILIHLEDLNDLDSFYQMKYSNIDNIFKHQWMQLKDIPQLVQGVDISQSLNIQPGNGFPI